MKRLTLILTSYCLLGQSLFASFIEKADAYNKNSSLQWQWAIQTIENYPWKGDERVLDIGCGDGKITALISDLATTAPVIGLDLSPQMIGYASQHFPPAEHPRLFFMEGDGAHVPFSKQFDLVVSFLALHWILDQEAALKSIWNSLKTDGKMLLLLPGTSPFNFSPACAKVCATDKWKPYFPDFKPQRAYFTKEQYEKLLTSAGFATFHVEASPTETIFPSMESFYDFLKPIATFTGHLSPKLQDEFIVDVAQIMLNGETPASDGSICARDIKLEIIAQKQ